MAGKSAKELLAAAQDGNAAAFAAAGSPACGHTAAATVRCAGGRGGVGRRIVFIDLRKITNWLYVKWSPTSYGPLKILSLRTLGPEKLGCQEYWSLHEIYYEVFSYKDQISWGLNFPGTEFLRDQISWGPRKLGAHMNYRDNFNYSLWLYIS